MCNLLIPLCPFVLHSVTTSSQSIQTYGSSDARILFSYLSKKPYDSPSDSSGQHLSPKPLKPLAQKTTKLYKRTSWHTCACFFRHVAVLHPMPGPSRPTFVTSHKPCARCSNAAKTLKPMRMGGLGDKTDPYWDRCIFAGARGVFEDGFSANFDVSGGNLSVAAPLAKPNERYALPSPAQPQATQINNDLRQSMASMSLDEDYKASYQQRTWHESRQNKNFRRERYEDRSSQVKQHHSQCLPSAPTNYGEDLDRYLNSTYGAKGSDKARCW